MTQLIDLLQMNMESFLYFQYSYHPLSYSLFTSCQEMQTGFIRIYLRIQILIPLLENCLQWYSEVESGGNGGGPSGGQGMILQINYSTPSSNSSSSSASETSSSSFFSSFSVLISGRQAGWNILRLLVQVIGTTFLNDRIIVPGLAVVIFLKSNI